MKSWKARVGLVCTMLAMVLAVSIPAVADVDLGDFEDAVEDEFVGVDDVDCSFADDDGDGLFDEEAFDGEDNDFDGLTDEDIVCVVDFDADEFADFDEFDGEDFENFDEFDGEDFENFDRDFFRDHDGDDNDNERERIDRIFR
jgi:hypothetical protein